MLSDAFETKYLHNIQNQFSSENPELHSVLNSPRSTKNTENTKSRDDSKNSSDSLKNQKSSQLTRSVKTPNQMPLSPISDFKKTELSFESSENDEISSILAKYRSPTPNLMKENPKSQTSTNFSNESSRESEKFSSDEFFKKEKEEIDNLIKPIMQEKKGRIYEMTDSSRICASVLSDSVFPDSVVLDEDFNHSGSQNSLGSKTKFQDPKYFSSNISIDSNENVEENSSGLSWQPAPKKSSNSQSASSSNHSHKKVKFNKSTHFSDHSSLSKSNNLTDHAHKAILSNSELEVEREGYLHDSDSGISQKKKQVINGVDQSSQFQFSSESGVEVLKNKKTKNLFQVDSTASDFDSINSFGKVSEDTKTIEKKEEKGDRSKFNLSKFNTSNFTLDSSSDFEEEYIKHLQDLLPADSTVQIVPFQPIRSETNRFDFKSSPILPPQNILSNVLQELTENAKRNLIDTSSEESSASRYSSKNHDEFTNKLPISSDDEQNHMNNEFRFLPSDNDENLLSSETSSIFSTSPSKVPEKPMNISDNAQTNNFSDWNISNLYKRFDLDQNSGFGSELESDESLE